MLSAARASFVADVQAAGHQQPGNRQISNQPASTDLPSHKVAGGPTEGSYAMAAAASEADSPYGDYTDDWEPYDD